MNTRSIILVAVAGAFTGCGAAGPAESPVVREMLLVDVGTGEAIVSPQTNEFPARHPVTGKRTLMPGLYCSECRRWHPTPPPEQLNHQPGAATCPKTGALLTPHGPWPGDAEYEPAKEQP